MEDLTTAESLDLGRRERRKLEMRARIREAATSLFERNGTEATTVQEICRVADVAQKTFFNHFPSKRHLMREIAQVSLDQLLLEIEEVRRQDASTREKIQSFFRRIADDAEAAGPTQRELLTEIVHVAHEPGTDRRQARQLHDAFGALIEEGLAAGDLSRRYDPDTLTEMLMGGFYVLMFNWANLDGYPQRDQAEETALFLADAMRKREGED